MESLADVLGKYQPQVPDEATAIKRYIEQEFKAPSSVLVKDDAIVITVNSASLANTLRLQSSVIRKTVNTTKRLIFRIG